MILAVNLGLCIRVARLFSLFRERRCAELMTFTPVLVILAEGAMTLPVTLSGGVLFAS